MSALTPARPGSASSSSASGRGSTTTSASDGRPPRRGLTGLQRAFGRHPIGVLLALPYAVFLAAVFAYPVVLAAWMSVHDWFFSAPGVEVDHPFVGFENYRQVLTDPQVHQAFLNIAVFLVINVPLTVALALVLAVALNRAARGRTFFRVAFYVPYVTASVALVGVWLFLLGGDGVVNSLLGPLAPDPSWLVNSSLAMPSIAGFVAWKQLGFFVLLYLAALQNVSKDLYEAASMDGAGRVRQFFTVTVPGVRTTTALVVILATITGANLFTEPYLLTGGGGPDGASTSPVLLMYQLGIEQGNPDTASALGIVLVVLVGLLVLLNRRLLRSES
ncbi:carbohydrate ABC transporter permease [Quadrisphaera setariae]|uniref:Sugar ABC transporter permease n=1 Tax=Quadrisphaera setariae TaxID=2593304 RepID=A0A5C8ZEM4_9ACTN|nr:sugar ABC transporter permease [Quadrisphaera setariae]TXR55653.1 sugar ABC transporter permease [Quadrisphaera setariae]